MAGPDQVDFYMMFKNDVFKEPPSSGGFILITGAPAEIGGCGSDQAAGGVQALPLKLKRNLRIPRLFSPKSISEKGRPARLEISDRVG